MRILFLSSFLLFPESRSGAAKRLYYFARLLARDHELSLACTDAGEEAESFCASSSPAAHFLHVRYSRSSLDRFRDPFAVPTYLSAEMSTELEKFVADARPEVVFCAFPFGLSLIAIPALRQVKNIVYLEDDLSFEVFRERMSKATNPLRKLHMASRWWQAEKFFQRLLPRVRSFIAISEEEAAIVRRKFPHLEVVIVGYGIPLDEYPALAAPTSTLALGFIGNFIHQSNSDAVRFFFAEWFPALKKRFPAATMQVAGKNLPSEIVEAGRADPSIIFRDNVPDLREFYEQISIFVNPIVSQRGLRTKLVEAAAFGRAIISTTLGAEGLEDMEMKIADSPEQFVEAFAQLQQPGALRDIADANRTVTEQLYSLEGVGRTLAQCLTQSAQIPS